MKIELVTETKGVGKLEGKSLEQVVAHIARISNPKNRDNESIEGLLRYCIRHRHWSIFQTVSLGFEIETSRGISPQMLRHASFDFQEYSQRYSSAIIELEPVDARRQDDKNRQNSIDDLSAHAKAWFDNAQQDLFNTAKDTYNAALKKGIAKECARTVLPIGTKTFIVMSGNLRSWMHYIVLRSANGTQKEHSDIAKAAHAIIKERYPLTGELIDFMLKADSLYSELLESLEV